MSNGPRCRLRSENQAQDAGRFPTRQLFVLAICRICEPIAFMSIFPYIYYMILSFNITQDERQVSVYAGMVTSAFALAEFSASVFWGRLSDRVGRKPILLTGLAGTGVSMLAFGFAPNLPIALIARAVGGILNGNIGVLNTAVAEVVTVKAHQPRAFTIMPFVWCLGSIIGAGLGGTLADPVKNYPSIFKPNSIFDRFPFLLPNLVCTFVVVLGLVVGILFLEESHEDKKYRRDLGLELGQRIVRLFQWKCKANEVGDLTETRETAHVFSLDEKRPSYQSTDSSRTSITSANEDVDFDPEYSPIPSTREKLSWRQGFTAQVLLIIIGYGILAFHTIALEQLLPLMFSMPESDDPPSSVLKFTGGFGLSSKTVGFILSSQGILQMIAQLLVFPIVQRRLGSLRTFRTVVFLYPVYYCLLPYLALLPIALRYPGIYLVLIFKVTAQSLAFPSVQIMIANAAPSKRVLGTINGFAASSASLARAFGPTVAGLVETFGLSIGYSILSWWTCAAVAIIGAAISMSMVDDKGGNQSKAMSRTGMEEDDLADRPLLAEGTESDSEPSPFATPRPSATIDSVTALTVSKES